MAMMPSKTSLPMQAYRVVMVALAAMIVAAAIVGAFRTYSPVPFWDMWNGYLDFFLRVRAGDFSAWWVQHNEHRIVLARILFWIDLTLFGGQGASLIVANYLLVATGAVVFCFAARDALRTSEHRAIAWAAMPLIWGAAFFWSQENNLTWGFQSQFILAQLLPMCALFTLGRAHTESTLGSVGRFVLACLLGVLSVGTMANGVLALPIMCVYAVVVGMRWDRVFVMAALAGATIVKYYSGYATGEGHAPLTETLRAAPVGVVKFVLAYLGSPVAFLWNRPTGGLVLAIVAGLAMVAIAATILLVTWKKRRNEATVYAMLAFLAYIGATALGTALGRISGGLEQALSSRYTTPALMAWCALLIAALPLVARRRASRRAVFALAPVALVALGCVQIKAIQYHDDMRFQRELGGLALALHVKDESAIGQVFPFTDWAMTIADKARAQGLSVFGTAPLIGASNAMGKMETVAATSVCTGTIEAADRVPGDASVVRLHGRIDRPATVGRYDQIHFVTSTGKVIGVAVDGSPTEGTRLTHSATQASGFVGYARATELSGTLTVLSTGSQCAFTTRVPIAAYTTLPQAPRVDTGLVSQQALDASAVFTGNDFDNSHFDHLRVLGSIITSDKDIGATVLHVRRGEHVYYRSGPTGGRQRIAIEGVFAARPLPVLREWTRLTFDDPRLPERFDVTIRDDGDAWGEWSAIAVDATEPSRP